MGTHWSMLVVTCQSVTQSTKSTRSFKFLNPCDTLLLSLHQAQGMNMTHEHEHEYDMTVAVQRLYMYTVPKDHSLVRCKSCLLSV
jgi:hypothetical protein